MFFKLVFVIVCLVGYSSAMIYSLNVTEYNKMPPLYKLDDYEACLQKPGGTYCVVDVALYSDRKSDLMRLIKGYSDHVIKHFNHTQIHRGICVTTTCKRYIQNYTNENTMDLEEILEACLNDAMQKNYGINGKLDQIQYCKRDTDKTMLDISDIVVLVVYFILIGLNVVGSLYDIKICKNKTGNPYLLAFSLHRNWAKLTAPSGLGPELRISRLKLFHGMRTMTMFCVFFSHTVLIIAFSYVENPLYIEKAYEDPLKQILFNGSLVTHTFFVMSSFLLAYNFQLHAEKHQVTWVQWPKGILLRWIRLMPTYALILATISTLMRYAGGGPLWDLVVGTEAAACRQYWWAHVLFINNYVYDDAWCAPQTWYLAADTQLFCLGLLVCVAARSARARQVVLGLLFVVALVITAGHTYFEGLSAVVIQSPEDYRELYKTDDTFRLLYIRGHTNMSTYILGLAGGFLTYYWQTEQKDFRKYRKYRWAYWLIFPLGVLVILSGGMFYVDGGVPPTWARVGYATLYKPVFQILVVLFIIGAIFKMETVYRGIVEWRGFTWTGRVSYSAFLLHTLFQRGFVGSQPEPIYLSDYFVMILLCATIFMSFAGAAILWLFVEAPVAALTKAVLAGGSRQRESSDV